MAASALFRNREENGAIKACLTSYVWFDSGPAKMMTNFYGLDEGTCKRRVRGHKERQDIPAPLAFVAYNMHMGGVDRADALRAYMSTAAVTKRWWVAVFYWVLDVAAVNAWILYCECHNLSEKQKKNGRNTFQDKLVQQLTGWTTAQGHASSNSKRRRDNNAKMYGKYNPNNPPPCRLDKVHHWPKENVKRDRCVVCYANLKKFEEDKARAKRNKQRFSRAKPKVERIKSYCGYCGCPLCLKFNHFEQFHQP